LGGSAAGLLDLSGLGLDRLAPQTADTISSMPSSATLSYVDLSRNRLTYLPLDLLFGASSPLSATPVKTLSASENLLGDGSGSVSLDAQPVNGEALTSLDVSRNRLSSFLLSELLSNGNLSELRVLSAGNNPLLTVDPLLNQLKQLRELRLGFCGLETVAPLDFRRLPFLAVLDVGNNKLKSVGDSIQDATALEFLSVENNDLKEIPAELALLPKLATLLIGGNPQRSVRPQVVQQGSAKVLELLRSRLAQPPPHSQVAGVDRKTSSSIRR
jgi:Leucine-rich repeat (LRR) protein